jgi:hypothetical protein
LIDDWTQLVNHSALSTIKMLVCRTDGTFPIEQFFPLLRSPALQGLHELQITSDLDIAPLAHLLQSKAFPELRILSLPHFRMLREDKIDQFLLLLQNRTEIIIKLSSNVFGIHLSDRLDSYRDRF